MGKGARKGFVRAPRSAKDPIPNSFPPWFIPRRNGSEQVSLEMNSHEEGQDLGCIATKQSIPLSANPFWPLQAASILCLRVHCIAQSSCSDESFVSKTDKVSVPSTKATRVPCPCVCVCGQPTPGSQTANPRSPTPCVCIKKEPPRM